MLNCCSIEVHCQVEHEKLETLEVCVKCSVNTLFEEREDMKCSNSCFKSLFLDGGIALARRPPKEVTTFFMGGKSENCSPEVLVFTFLLYIESHIKL